MEKTIINDSENRRTIVKDWDNDSLTIMGDFAPSSLSVYCVISRNSGRLYTVSLTRKYALQRCLFYSNKFLGRDSFEVVQRTLFV